MLLSKYLENFYKYKSFVELLGFEETFAKARIEAQFESIKDWSEVGDIKAQKAWFLEQKAKCTMDVVEIPLNECSGWLFEEKTGNITHESESFFKIEGLRTSLSEHREVKNGWDQPILTQIGYDGGLLGILRKRINGIPHYLLEAKAEPGNYGIVLLSPTLQATFSNLECAHGGNKPKYADLFENPEKYNATVLFSNWMSEDGGRLYKKRNKGILIEVTDDMGFDIPQTFNWFSLWQIKELIKEDAWVNPHIRSIISHL
jgi:oxidase EvaA